MSIFKQPSSFSVILLTVAIAVVGLLSARHLSIHYTPQEKPEEITVSYYYRDASSKVIERSITSLLEGALSKIANSTGTSSISSKGYGSVTVKFRRGTDMAIARFEAATQIRNIYPSLPKGVTYPEISVGTTGRKGGEVLVFLLKGNIPSTELYEYATENIVRPLSDIKGIDRVDIRGYSPFHWVVVYDAVKIAAAGITPQQITAAITEYYTTEAVTLANAEQEQITVYLKGGNGGDLGKIPIAKSGSRIIYLADIATYRYEESVPSSYYRLNGLNTISISVNATQTANSIEVAKEAKKLMNSLSEHFPTAVSFAVGYDSSIYISAELNKIYRRTALSLIVLLFFVLIAYRSVRYTIAVGLAILANLLIALLLYYLLGLQIHLYSLAGITVSLGIIIDSSIVMTDHYTYYKNRAAFVPVFGAIATTIASLLAVLLIPYNQRLNLTDFVASVSVNLFISLLVAYFFVPALIDYIPTALKTSHNSYKRYRRYVNWNRFYSRYIKLGVRFKWLYILLLIAGFGLPLCLIPSETALTLSGEPHSTLVKKIALWKPYSANKTTIDRVLGSSFALFYRSLSRLDFSRTPQRLVLSIRTGLSEGHTVSQLNTLVRDMENFLSQFEEIELFRTNVWSYDDAAIEVYFKPEYEKTSAPLKIKSEIIKAAMNFGGANWIVSGIDDKSFSNYIGSSFSSNNIELIGYEYDKLIGYAEQLVSFLEKNPRVRAADIRSSWRSMPRTEYNLSYDFETLSAIGVNPYSYYNSLNNLLYSSTLYPMIAEHPTEVVLRSSLFKYYDLWHIQNSPIAVDSTFVTLSKVGQIVKRKTDLDIVRRNQSYSVVVSYGFIGEHNLNKKLNERALAYMNGSVLPIGYKAQNAEIDFFFNQESAGKYGWVILIIIAIIYVFLSILFESFRQPLAVLFLIPISFIGVFLTFGLSNLIFDHGGFAAFIMLCGIVVNAGIYLVWAYKGLLKKPVLSTPQSSSMDYKIKNYVKAYNLKVRPIFLTIASTVLGLLPFLIEGPAEVFWFNFAIGTIAGLLFSVVALLLYLPIFILHKTA